jgi:trehalose 6-phosphate synthase/phosphatase
MSLREPRSTIVTHRLPQRPAQGPSSHTEDLVARLEAGLAPFCQAWVGAGTSEACPGDVAGYRRVAVEMPDDDVVGRWREFSQSALWPLFHNVIGQCRFRRDDWESYLEVNRRFALSMIRSDAIAAPIWVHDHRLIHTATMLRAVKPHLGGLGFFMHLPFPAYDTLRRLPWMAQLLGALLEYDVIGFQTRGDLHNFLVCADQLGHSVASHDAAGGRVTLRGRSVRAVALPCSSDAASLAEYARRDDVFERARRIRGELAPCSILVGVDGPDRANGVLHKLHAFEAALLRYPSLRGRVVLYQVVTPPRAGLDDSAAHCREIERTIGRISGRFATPGWTPIRYHHRHLDSVELSALYGAADAAMVTPLRRGMSLTAKDFVASRTGDNGSLILSEACGAAAELGEGSWVVNPYDIEQTARTIWRVRQLSRTQQARRMRLLRRQVAEHDLGRWAERLGASLAQSDELVRPALVPLSGHSADGARPRLPYS